MDIWKDNPETGFWSNDFDLFYRVIDPTAGNFVTDEVRLTDSYTHDYVLDLVPDESGGFEIIFGPGLPGDDDQYNDSTIAKISYDPLNGYQAPASNINVPMFRCRTKN